MVIFERTMRMPLVPGEDLWNSEVRETFRDEDGLVLLDESLEALEMSGHDICRPLCLRRNDPEYFGSERGAVELVELLDSFDAAVLAALVLYHVQGHLFVENPVLKLLRRFIPSPLPDELVRASCCPTKQTV